MDRRDRLLAATGSILTAAAIVFGGCSEDPQPQAEPPEGASPAPSVIDVDVPVLHEDGKLVAEQSGCLACHRFGTEGNRGPGPDLTDVGARLTPNRIRSALVQPSGIMPSYEALSDRKLEALVRFLAGLRG